MRQALARERFRLHYQPQVAAGSGAIVGAEALIRWNDPELGEVPPGASSRWPRERLHRRDRRLGAARRPWRRRALATPRAGRCGVGQRLGAAVPPARLRRRRGARAARERPAGHLLELELTESILIQDADGFARGALRARGAGRALAIDDFGTGYSSLGYLKRLPITRLKIDRSFVTDLPGDASDASIVDAIVKLGRALGMT